MNFMKMFLYDIESLFISILVQETRDYILQRIYIRKEIKPFCKKSIFEKLLLKLTWECVFSVNNRLISKLMVAQQKVTTL